MTFNLRVSWHIDWLQTFSNGLNVTGSVKLVPHVKMTGFGYRVVKNLESGTL
jgi:hypothetical protein